MTKVEGRTVLIVMAAEFLARFVLEVAVRTAVAMIKVIIDLPATTATAVVAAILQPLVMSMSLSSFVSFGMRSAAREE